MRLLGNNIHRAGNGFCPTHLPPVMPLDGVAGDQHYCPELGEGLPHFFEVLPGEQEKGSLSVFSVSVSVW